MTVFGGCNPCCGPTRQEGMALAIVVWFIAGMSLLVSGIVAQARVDTQLAQLHVARAKVAAAGDGAINLALLDRTRQAPGAGGQDKTKAYWIGEIEVAIDLVSTSGLLDLNEATQEQLALLLVSAANLPNSDAGVLATNVLKWRSGGVGKNDVGNNNKKRTTKSRARFDAPEDLLLVPGFSRSMLDAVRDYVVAGKPAQGQFDLSAAPSYVRQALSRAFSGQAQTGEGGRSGNDGVGAGFSGSYRVDAVVLYGDARWLRRRWVTAGYSEYSALPWQVVRTEPARVDERRNHELR